MGADKGDYEQDDWILCYRADDSRAYAFSWMYAHYVVKIPSVDRAYSKSAPYQVIQVNKLKAYGAPPFMIEPRFRKAFRRAYREYCQNPDIADFDSVIPSNELIDQVFKHFE